jgi:hypothetical protein
MIRARIILAITVILQAGLDQGLKPGQPES